ncbi:MAG: lipoate--protein ligase [Gemmatimonadaceae bacterium]
MRFVDNGNSTNPFQNLALEEYVLRHRMDEDDLLLFYVNEPSIIIGRNQNTIEEIASDVVEERGIHVVRRVSGGGAVYHDRGNLNFSFMTRDVHGRFNRYDDFNGPVVEVLRAAGVPAELSGRNDIVAEGRKISGNAQFATPDRMLSHGTLLFDSNLDEVVAALKPKAGKVESKGVKSIRSRVANISEFAKESLDVEELRNRILQRIFGTRDRALIPTLPMTSADWHEVRQLQSQKYESWDWNYGQNPASNVQRAQRFSGGEIDVRYNILDGRIAGVRIFGDFLGQHEVSELEGLLLGLPFDLASVGPVLDAASNRNYFGTISPDEMRSVLAP